MAKLRGHPLAALIELPLDDQRPTDATANVAIEDHPMPLAAAKPGLSQPGTIGVIGHERWTAKRLASPVSQRKVGPTFDLMAGNRSPLGNVDGPAKAKPNRLHPVPLDKRPSGLGDLPPNTFGPVFWLHVQPL